MSRQDLAMVEAQRSIGPDQYTVFVVIVCRRNPQWVAGGEGSPVVTATDVFDTLQDALRHLESAKLDANTNWVRMMFRAGWTVQEWQNPDRLAEHEQTGSRRG